MNTVGGLLFINADEKTVPMHWGQSGDNLMKRPLLQGAASFFTFESYFSTVQCIVYIHVILKGFHFVFAHNFDANSLRVQSKKVLATAGLPFVIGLILIQLKCEFLIAI